MRWLTTADPARSAAALRTDGTGWPARPSQAHRSGPRPAPAQLKAARFQNDAGSQCAAQRQASARLRERAASRELGRVTIHVADDRMTRSCTFGLLDVICPPVVVVVAAVETPCSERRSPCCSEQCGSRRGASRRGRPRCFIRWGGRGAVLGSRLRLAEARSSAWRAAMHGLTGRVELVELGAADALRSRFDRQVGVRAGRAFRMWLSRRPRSSGLLTM